MMFAATVCLLVLFGDIFQQCNGLAKVNFYLYRRGQSQKLLSWVPDNFDREKPTFVLLHGTGGSKDGSCVQNLTEALLEKSDANILAPDYHIAGYTYVVLYRDITKQIAKFLLKNNVDPERTTAFGMSLGAQIAGGFHSYGFKPKEIIGMDPAGPAFSWFMPNSMQLNPLSADYVQAVHTNVGRYGSTSLDGHLDLYINHGTNFPCCTDNFCKHRGACDWTVSTIRKGAVETDTCQNQKNARSGACHGRTIFAGFGASHITNERTVAHLNIPEDACFFEK